MNDSSSTLIRQGTCLVLINGQIKGTAWLVTSEGHLLTAGHILGQQVPAEKVEVRFVEDIPLTAYKIQWDYQPLAGTDFAILKLVSPLPHLHPLPISLAKEVTGSFRLCGFGITLRDLSEGTGSFVGNFVPQNFPGNLLFSLQSKQTGEVGYSGSAIFSEVLQAVVALQIESTLAKTGPGRDTILAMPLYRIAQRWDLLNQLLEVQNDVLFDTTALRSDHFVGRNKEMEELKKLIFASNPQSVVITALHGMGGVGKTALITEFVYRYSNQFPGGILWADFPSNQGDPLPILASWAQLCGRADLKDLPSIDIRARNVNLAIKEQIKKNGKMLAVFDDVRSTAEDAWLDNAHILRKAIPEGVALIVTTRQSGVAESLRVRRILSLDSLKTEEALNLIKMLAPDIPLAIANELTHLTGNLPLAIEIIANKVKGDELNWLMESLRNPETRLDILNVESTNRKEDSIRLSFSLSFQSLPNEAAELFQILGIFTQGYIAEEWITNLVRYNYSNRENKFPDAYFVVKHLRSLVDKSLLQRTRTGYRFHPLLCNYAQLLLKLGGMYDVVALAHMNYFLDLAARADTSQSSTDIALENITQAFEYAYNEMHWNEVIKCVRDLAVVGKFLHSRGHWQRAIEILYKGVQSCERLGDLHQRVAFLCQIGIHQRELGHYDIAETTFQEAITLAEELEDDRILANVYFNAGYLQLYQARFDEAMKSLKKAIDFAEKSGNNNALGEALRGLGRIMLSQGNLDLAESYLQRSRSILAQAENLQGLAYSLRSLGEVYTVRKLYEQSLDYLNQALQVASTIGDKQAIAYIHRGLGDTYRWQGNHQSALEAYLESESLYRDVGDRAALSGALCSAGEIYFISAAIDKAQKYFSESNDLAQHVQVTRWQGRSLFGLAQVQEMLGNKTEAIQLGRQALQILESAGHRDVKSVQDWLEKTSIIDKETDT